MTTPTVQPIRANQVAKLGQTMSKAFFDDPLMEYMVPDIEKRLKIGNWFMAKAIGYCHKWGEVYADADLSGGAAWLSPGNTTMSTLRIIRAGLWQMPFRIGLSGMSRFNRLDGETAKVHKKLMPGDHWYLLMLGVDPGKQKSGIGSAAIDVGAAKAQQAGLPVYLETMTQTNVEYYMKRGFEIGEEFDIEGNLHTWAMVRNPS
jgi:ribosomal protein S18 acetylase RimI-like enzyme